MQKRPFVAPVFQKGYSVLLEVVGDEYMGNYIVSVNIVLSANNTNGVEYMHDVTGDVIEI